ncbi:MAG TPA: hypothetical protein VMN03_09085 [Burkholderiales bacterium]|nr:hypothetical protein [Burkholderiales bacterium]
MKTANWRSTVSMKDGEIDPADLEAVLSTVDEADFEEELDLDNPWNPDFDPTDDDPE